MRCCGPPAVDAVDAMRVRLRASGWVGVVGSGTQPRGRGWRHWGGGNHHTVGSMWTMRRAGLAGRGGGGMGRGRRSIASGTTNGIQWYNASVSSPFRHLPGDWTVVPLGTVSAMPNRTRNVSATLLRTGGFCYLFDAGEGTQSRITDCFASSLRSIRRVFITHCHGDHVFGLPAVVAYVVQAARAHEVAGVATPPRLQVFGPVGIHQLIRAALATLGRAGLERLPLDVTELVTPGYRVPPAEVVARTVCGKHAYAYPNAEGVYDLVDEGDHVVQAAGLKHTTPCFGYSVTEKQRRHLVPDLLMARGIQPGKLYSHIVEGKEVHAPDGTTVKYEDVSVLGAPGRRVVILGDNCDARAMAPIAMHADIVTHEATLPDGDRGKAVERGHATPGMAGEFAALVQARRLVLTHFSPSFGYHPADASIHHLGVREVRDAIQSWRAGVEGTGSSSPGGGPRRGGSLVTGGGGWQGDAMSDPFAMPLPSPTAGVVGARSGAPHRPRPRSAGSTSPPPSSSRSSRRTFATGSSRPRTGPGARGGADRWDVGGDEYGDVPSDGDMDYSAYSIMQGGGAGVAGLHPLELGVFETARDGDGGTRSLQENIARVQMLLSGSTGAHAAGAGPRWQPIPLTAYAYPPVADTVKMMLPTRGAQRAFGREEVVCARDFMAIPLPPPPTCSTPATTRVAASFRHGYGASHPASAPSAGPTRMRE